MSREIVVGDMVRNRARAEGAACERWLANLGDLVESLEADWGIAVGGPLAGGTAAFVAEAVTSDGTPAVLKLAMPAEREGRAALENEVRMLRLVDGRGCVRVYDADADRGAVLLERLGRQLVELGLAVTEQLRAICSVLETVWAVPCDITLPSLDDKGRWLAEFIGATWEELDHPCSAAVVDLAITCAERRSAAFEPERAVPVHGDAHPWNTLEDPVGGAGTFRLVDPDGLLAEPEYDLAIPMREFNEELVAGDTLGLGRARARFLAEQTGLDERKIWEWGYVERVSTGLLALKEGLVGAADFLVVAERWRDTRE